MVDEQLDPDPAGIPGDGLAVWPVQDGVAGCKDENSQVAVAVVRDPLILLNHPDEGPQGSAVRWIREHVSLGGVLKEVDKTIASMRDRLDANVQNDCHFHRHSGVAEVLVDELELVLDRLPKDLPGAGSCSEYGCCTT
jgi:hypothetical protein